MTGESAQLYRRHGDRRLCVAVAERGSGLRDTVPIGAVLSMEHGKFAQLSWWDYHGYLLAGLLVGIAYDAS